MNIVHQISNITIGKISKLIGLLHSNFRPALFDKIAVMRYFKIYTTIHLLISLVVLSSYGQGKNNHSIAAKNDSKKAVITEDKTQKAKVDTLNVRLNRIEKENQLIITETKKQYSDIKRNFEKLSNPSFNVNKDFTYPTVLSIVSAVIFWFAFSYIPEKRRTSRIRPKLELDMYNVYMNVFWVFDNIMSWSNNSPSMYQDKIKSNQLSLDDIELGLQNKCLNESYLFDNDIKDKLLIIGHDLYKRSVKIEKTVERIFLFSQYLTADEIILLERILKKMQTYDLADYNKSALSNFNGLVLRPVNPSISYMKANLFELYQLFNDLRKIVQNNKYYDWGVAIDKIQYLYSNQEYKKCLKYIYKASTDYPIHKDFLNNYRFLCQYNLNKKNITNKEINEVLSKNTDLVTSRSFFRKIQDDARIKKMMEEYYSADELEKLYTVKRKEDVLVENFKNNAKLLKEYYIKTEESSRNYI